MTTYLFVTDADEYDAKGVETHHDYTWSCSKTTMPGDLALVYVKGGGIAYEWELTSKAEPDKKWRYRCGVSYVREFSPPISLEEIRSAISRAEWAPPYANFRGYRSIRVPEVLADRLRDLRVIENRAGGVVRGTRKSAVSRSRCKQGRAD